MGLIGASGKPAIPVALGLCATASTSATIMANVMARPAGCKYRRIDWNWWTNQATAPPGGTQPGQWDTLTDGAGLAVVKAAHNAGSKLVLMGGYTPPWAGGNGTDGHNYPRDQANGCRDWANALYVAAWKYEMLYPGTVLAWEFGNEPNGFGLPGNVTLYGLCLETAYKLFRTGVLLGRPNRPPLPTSVQLWSGGTGAGAPVGSPNRHLNWSRALLQRPVRCLDGVGIHMYSAGCPLGTSNGYDPLINDIPGITQAIVDSPWASIADPLIQIQNTEAGYFWRDDSTPTATDCGDQCNCNSYGKGPNPNEKIEVTVTTAATRLRQHWDVWKAAALFFPVGLSFYFQQNTVSPNNTATTGSGGASAAFDHAGLYVYDPNRNGAPVLDGSGNPALVNAIEAIYAPSPAPTVTSISPKKGLTTGGTAVTVTGTGFDSSTVCTIDGTTCTISSFTTTTLDIVTPAHAQGAAPLVVSNANGSSTPINFQYKPVTTGTIPTVTGVSPASGIWQGGTSVVLTGTSFDQVDSTDPAAVTFGNVNATDYTVDSATQITATTPAGIPGPVLVIVTDATGPSDAATFTYTSAPPVWTPIALQTADGNIVRDFTHPISISGRFTVAWGGTDDFDPYPLTSFVQTSDGTFLTDGVAANGIYGAAVDSTVLTDGTHTIQLGGHDNDPGAANSFASFDIVVSNTPTEVGFFADLFYTNYTTPPVSPPPPPTVTIESAEPNPLP